MTHPAPTTAKRRKTGGRQKGTPNKTTVAIRDAMLSVFADLQAETGSENGHFLEWAKGNATEFYRLASKLLPLQVTGEGGGPVVTRIELVAPALPPPADSGPAPSGHALAPAASAPAPALPPPPDRDSAP